MARHEKRGPDGRFIKAGTGVGALALVFGVIAIGGGGGAGALGGAATGGGTAGGGAAVSSNTGGAAGGSSVSSGGGSGSSASRPGRGSSDTRAVRARDRDQNALARRLAREGRNVRRLDGDVATDCAAVSYGQVRTFFTTTPCDAVGRAVFEVREAGARVVVAVAVVDMPTVDGAVALKRLVDTPGTGNVRELRSPRGVRWTGQHYHSVRDGATVVNAQAEPVGAGAAAARLAGRVSREAAAG